MNKYVRLTLSLVTGLTLLSVPALAMAANPSLSFDPLWGAYGNLNDTGLGTTDPVVVVAQIVNVFLRLLGLLSVLLMLYGGWIWIWARGNEEEITRAKDIIRGSIIGLIVILSSYGVMQWVFYYLTSITNAT
jgi:cytochrome bd-type quinol oxidase subunit 2